MAAVVIESCEYVHRLLAEELNFLVVVAQKQPTLMMAINTYVNVYIMILYLLDRFGA
jgi:hypothetical protein